MCVFQVWMQLNQVILLSSTSLVHLKIFLNSGVNLHLFPFFRILILSISIKTLASSVIYLSSSVRIFLHVPQYLFGEY